MVYCILTHSFEGGGKLTLFVLSNIWKLGSHATQTELMWLYDFYFTRKRKLSHKTMD